MTEPDLTLAQQQASDAVHEWAMKRRNAWNADRAARELIKFTEAAVAEAVREYDKAKAHATQVWEDAKGSNFDG